MRKTEKRERERDRDRWREEKEKQKKTTVRFENTLCRGRHWSEKRTEMLDGPT